ncbi:MAG: ParB/RepB/Spo0J family partition protein [Thermoanaerobaculia bacterium]
MSPKRQPLGRGLSALLPGKDEKRDPSGSREVEVAKIRPGRLQPRTSFRAESLAELAKSIQSNGIVQPILVAPAENGEFTILAGERRFRAAKQAGLTKVPVVVRVPRNDEERLEIALIENLQREDLNPMEEAAAYGRLREEFHLTQEQIAEKVGKDRSTVANSLRILRLQSHVRDLIRSGELSAGHAKAIAALSSADDQMRLADEIVRRGLSVREAEARAAAMSRPAMTVRKEKKRDPFSRDAEEKLSRRLHAKVRLQRRRRGGSIAIDFASEEELIRLFEILMGKA